MIWRHVKKRSFITSELGTGERCHASAHFAAVPHEEEATQMRTKIIYLSQLEMYVSISLQVLLYSIKCMCPPAFRCYYTV
jgi:hypothetical protein